MNKHQLVWRCRRGIRELDVLFGQFLEKEYSKLDQQEQSTFHQMLEIQDPIIMDWLFDKYKPEDEAMLRLVRSLQDLSGINK